ncbi:hypothetical protein J6590_011292 [Homalodisca vitripennis]|nr:hypothetical protein J6590_011292 [Homalodisca vitripennis]
MRMHTAVMHDNQLSGFTFQSDRLYNTPLLLLGYYIALCLPSSHIIVQGAGVMRLYNTPLLLLGHYIALCLPSSHIIVQGAGVMRCYNYRECTQPSCDDNQTLWLTPSNLTQAVQYTAPAPGTLYRTLPPLISHHSTRRWRHEVL